MSIPLGDVPFSSFRPTNIFTISFFFYITFTKNMVPTCDLSMSHMPSAVAVVPRGLSKSWQMAVGEIQKILDIQTEQEFRIQSRELYDSDISLDIQTITRSTVFLSVGRRRMRGSACDLVGLVQHHYLHETHFITDAHKSYLTYSAQESVIVRVYNYFYFMKFNIFILSSKCIVLSLTVGTRMESILTSLSAYF